jgi:WD40 repeat protein
LASGHTDGAIRFWSPLGADPCGPWALVRELRAHGADVRALAALPGGRLASASEDGTVRVWGISGEECAAAGRHADFATGLCRLGDGRLASASYDGTVKLWGPWPT